VYTKKVLILETSRQSSEYPNEKHLGKAPLKMEKQLDFCPANFYFRPHRAEVLIHCSK